MTSHREVTNRSAPCLADSYRLLGQFDARDAAGVNFPISTLQAGELSDGRGARCLFKDEVRMVGRTQPIYEEIAAGQVVRLAGERALALLRGAGFARGVV